jgi:hypothetical protein
MSAIADLNLPQNLEIDQNEIARLKILIAQGWATKVSE